MRTQGQTWIKLCKNPPLPPFKKGGGMYGRPPLTPPKRGIKFDRRTNE